ncbi:MAG: carbamoyltransferase [Phycisphaerae bacterium]
MTVQGESVFGCPDPRRQGAVIVRRRVAVQGRVQGVGFRPFVYRLATDLRLGGIVGNDSHGAFIEIEGPLSGIETFLERLYRELPPLARVSRLSVWPLAPRDDRYFRIDSSLCGGHQDAEITADVAVCDDCLAEMLNPRDRRYRYPFINCINCGPRYSIIQGVPYDRPNTTMAAFTMCAACAAEYNQPLNRRFHAQPNACPVCGPRLWMTDAQGNRVEGDPVARCARWLHGGAIVAIKGIGGFHLACRADDESAVRRLRVRKQRESKAFAIMVPSLETAAELAQVDESSAAALRGPARPIVLLGRRTPSPVAPSVAAGSTYLGLMLPYTPLHHLLFAENTGPLVMTSANPSEEPLCCQNQEALDRLARIADAFLLNDRDIERRVDDSVLLSVREPTPRALPIRRARGFAPSPIEVPLEAPQSILAVGGEMKSTICLLSGRQAIVSEHLGELSNATAFRNFVITVEQFKKLLRASPAVVACDLHPDYAATRYAQSLDLKIVGVQHHHAHIVSCMADNDLTGPVVGIACDGTGFGTDGAIWGCELMICDEAEFERVGQLAYFPLLGGDAAAQETWRPAVGLLQAAFGPAWRESCADLLDSLDPEALDIAAARLRTSRLPLTSSLGRLFDGVAYLLGVCDRNRHEAEAATLLEAAAASETPAAPLPYSWTTSPEGRVQLEVGPMVVALIEGLRAGYTAGQLARAFHETLICALAEGVRRVAAGSSLHHVVLSGGCFANRLLLEGLCARVREDGLEVFAHQKVPTGDGGLALGQAVAAAEMLRRNMPCA